MEKNGRPILHKIKNENNKRVFDYYRKNPIASKIPLLNISDT